MYLTDMITCSVHSANPRDPKGGGDVIFVHTSINPARPGREATKAHGMITAHI